MDGPTNSSSIINTYYPPISTVNLNNGSTMVQLLAVPPNDPYGNIFGTVPISSGDLILFIQIQDGTINTNNSNLYGSNSSVSGPDGLGGTGYVNIGSAGLYEYAIALNNVALTGGPLLFRASGIGGGLINTYINNPGNGTTVGKKTFQVVRVPQYSSLSMSQNILCPPFNGNVGGLITFDVAGDFNFNGFTIDASLKGFRGGFQYIIPSGCINSLVYATSNEVISSVKGEGIAGTPRFMWDGYNEVDYGALWNGFPGFYYGKGAPANAGGGGNDANAGGGGGGNGGGGGVGGNSSGNDYCPGSFPGDPSGGRPGINFTPLNPNRLFMGGGGGGGDANDALNGTKGGVGGGIIIIHAGRIIGNGLLLANGGDGQRGIYSNHPDGAGGGGAGGTIILNVSNNSPTSVLNIKTKGGKGGNTVNDLTDEHGPGGGGGGGVIWYTVQSGNITTEVNFGLNGLTNDGNPGAITHGANSGQNGYVGIYTNANLPIYLQGQGSTCYPSLNINKSELHSGVSGSRPAGNSANYSLTISNASSGGGASGIIVNDPLPIGFTFLSASATYSGGATGPATLINIGSPSNPILGTFNIPSGSSVIITLVVYISTSVLPGIYHNGTQVLYLDPTRTLSNPSRLITPNLNSIIGQNTTYQSGVNTGVIVPGANYNGTPSGPNFEDVYIIAAGSIPINFETCERSILQLDVIPPALTSPFTYLWTGPATFSPNGNSKNPTILNTQLSNSGNYTVLITDVNGFTSTYITTVTINPTPNLSITNPTNICLPSSIDLTDVSITTGSNLQGATLSYWTDAAATTTLVNPNYIINSGTYYIKATIAGCMDIKPVFVTINPKLNLTITKSNDIDCIQGYAKLFATGGNQYSWTPTSSLNNSLIRNPTASPQVTTTYYVKVTSNYGCIAEDSIKIFVNNNKTGDYSLPNAFTPNNDGLNDCIRVKYWGKILEFEFNIYNRWGQRVFYTTDLSKCWDGNVNGVLQKSDVYVYWIRSKTACTDKVFKKGTITLIR